MDVREKLVELLENHCAVIDEDNCLVICEKCWRTGHVNGGDENSTWSKTCEDCHGIGFSRVPMTNADRIRAMSDEELLHWLLRLQDDAIKRFANFELPNYQGLAEWLKQPAEE